MPKLKGWLIFSFYPIFSGNASLRQWYLKVAEFFLTKQVYECNTKVDRFLL